MRSLLRLSNISSLQQLRLSSPSLRIPFTTYSQSNIRFKLIVGLTLGLLTFQKKVACEEAKQSSAKKVRIAGNIKIGGQFTCLDASGNTITEKNFEGKYMIMYFGYTRCPDVCPSNLKKMDEVIKIIQKQKSNHEINYVFMSLDPERDTPEQVKDYCNLFNSKIQGLVVPQNERVKVMQTFKLYCNKIQAQGEDNYVLDHTNYWYLMDKNGKLLNIITQRNEPEEAALIIKETIDEKEAEAK